MYFYPWFLQIMMILENVQVIELFMCGPVFVFTE